MKTLIALLSAAAFLGCMPSTGMSKADFMKCVRGYPDELRIARKYGMPETITRYNTGQASNTQDQAGMTWVYTHPKPLFFHFDATGHVLQRTNAKHQRSHSR